MLTKNQNVIAKRYVLIDELGAGGMGIVFRAVDRLTGQVVALKQLGLSDQPVDSPSKKIDNENEDIRLLLAREFRTLASLRHPNIISVLDYGFDERGHPFFTMELLENAFPFLVAGRKRDFNEQIILIVDVLRALAYLHRRGVVHRDLKPDNVQVVDNQVKVLDFGLALSKTYVASREDTYSGTLWYMAPEILGGHSATEQADLYAVGVMAYELFAGRHPFAFDGLNIIEFANAVRTQMPDFSALKIPKSLIRIIDRLLAKKPEERYRNVRDAVDDLYDAIGHTAPFETIAIRESFIQAADFVGREKELGVLSEAIGRAVNGQGSAWMISGESGVGKSRLLTEFRSHALVQGVLVMQGRAEQSQDGYKPWLEIMRWLATLCEPSDLEASVLMEIFPEAERLVGRPIDRAPDIDPQRAQLRLFSTVTTLLQRLQQPTILLFEDIHWLSVEAMALLRWVVKIVHNRALLVIGSFRDDERPQHVHDLPGAHHLKLERLTENDIETLSGSMLGNASTPEVVKLLQRETEGNAFFMVEVVRALAERAGQLDEIGQAELPRQVITGGIQRIIQYRLDKVPQKDRDLLQLAAVAGRFLDLNLLHSLATKSRIERWLLDCADTALLDIQDGEWRFSHERLRETLLEQLSKEQRSVLHRTIALTLETVYEDITQHVSALAQHWSEAGNVEKELHYCILAGQQAARRFANDEAIAFFSRALDLSPMDIAIAYELAKVWQTTGNWREAERIVQLALSFTTASETEQHTRGFLYALLGELLIVYKGDYKAGLSNLETAQEIFEANHEIEGLIHVFSAIGRANISQGNFDQGLEYFSRLKTIAKESNNLRGLSEAFRNIGHIYAQRAEDDQALFFYQEALNIAHQEGDLKNIASSHGSLGVLMANTGNLASALEHNLHQLKSYQRIGDVSSASDATMAIGSLYMLSGDFTASEIWCKQGLQNSMQLDDMLGTSIGLIYLAENYLNQHRYEEAEVFAKLAIAIVRKLKKVYHLVGYLITCTKIVFEQGNFHEATELNREAARLSRETGIRDFEFLTILMAIKLRFRLDQTDRTQALFDLETLITQWPKPEHQADIYFAMWEIDQNRNDSASAAADLYRELYRQSPQHKYQQQYKLLQGESLPDLVQLPRLPEFFNASVVEPEISFQRIRNWLGAKNENA